MKFFAKIKEFFINLSDGIRFAHLLITGCLSGDEE